jgi:hypothetical protein
MEVAEGTATGAQQAVLDELAAMLDALAPAGLDRSRSHLVWSPATSDSKPLQAQITLEHVSQPAWQIRVEVEAACAVIYWLSVHEHVDEDDAWLDRPWTSVVVDAVAAILRGEYEVEEITRLGRWYQTRVIDVAVPAGPQLRQCSGPLWFWLLRPFRATITRRRVDFTCP